MFLEFEGRAANQPLVAIVEAAISLRLHFELNNFERLLCLIP